MKKLEFPHEVIQVAILNSLRKAHFIASSILFGANQFCCKIRLCTARVIAMGGKQAKILSDVALPAHQFLPVRYPVVSRGRQCGGASSSLFSAARQLHGRWPRARSNRKYRWSDSSMADPPTDTKFT